MLWMLPLAGAAAGALLNKKDPLKGALMGGALGAGGMAAAPALGIGAASAAGGAAGGAAAAGSAGAASAGTAGTAGAAGTQGGLLSGFMQYADPAMKGIGAASQAQGLLNPPEQPIQAQPLQSKPVDFGGLLSQRPQAMIDQDRYMQRIQAMMQGGYRG